MYGNIPRGQRLLIIYLTNNIPYCLIYNYTSVFTTYSSKNSLWSINSYKQKLYTDDHVTYTTSTYTLYKGEITTALLNTQTLELLHNKR